MPVYEYACQSCHQTFEAEQRITDKPLGRCPHCKGRSVKRLISRTGFVLKGSGWYTSDYARKGGGASNGASAKKDKGADTAPCAGCESAATCPAKDAA